MLGCNDQTYISNYAFLQVRDVLSRVEGVGDVVVFGAREYSMRVWLDTYRMWSRQLTADDVISAIQSQNVPVAAGSLGSEPAPPGTNLQLFVNTQGRLITPEQFGQIIVKSGNQGEIVHLSDVARVELGAREYGINSNLDGKPAQAIGIYQQPGSNAVATTHHVLIGFVVLVGLACKNAILIVEYARQQMQAGVDRHEATVNAAKLRLRPILMTSFAFGLGVWPLVYALGPGSEMRQALGTACIEVVS